jgi:hypothetical protein
LWLAAAPCTALYCTGPSHVQLWALHKITVPPRSLKGHARQHANAMRMSELLQSPLQVTPERALRSISRIAALGGRSGQAPGADRLITLAAAKPGQPLETEPPEDVVRAGRGIGQVAALLMHPLPTEHVYPNGLGLLGWRMWVQHGTSKLCCTVSMHNSGFTGVGLLVVLPSLLLLDLMWCCRCWQCGA